MSDAVIIYKGEFKRVPGYVENPDSMVATAMLINLVKEAGAVIERHYPRWKWLIRPDEKGGIVDFSSLMLNAAYGYTVFIPTMQSDPTLKCVVEAGGEVLERFGFRRGPYSYAEWRKRNQVMGQFIPDVSDLPGQIQRTMRAQQIRTAFETGHARICTNPIIGQALAAREQAPVNIRVN